MKITVSRLKELINEELSTFNEEQEELEEGSGDRNDPDREQGHGPQRQRVASDGSAGEYLEEGEEELEEQEALEEAGRMMADKQRVPDPTRLRLEEYVAGMVDNYMLQEYGVQQPPPGPWGTPAEERAKMAAEKRAQRDAYVNTLFRMKDRGHILTPAQGEVLAQYGGYDIPEPVFTGTPEQLGLGMTPVSPGPEELPSSWEGARGASEGSSPWSHIGLEEATARIVDNYMNVVTETAADTKKKAGEHRPVQDEPGEAPLPKKEKEEREQASKELKSRGGRPTKPSWKKAKEADRERREKEDLDESDQPELDESEQPALEVNETLAGWYNKTLFESLTKKWSK